MNDYGIKQAVILAAGERKDFDRPVGFLEIEDTIVIERLIRILKEKGIEDIIIITGYQNQYFDNLDNTDGLQLVYSDKYKWTSTMQSLALAEQYVEDDFFLIEGDLIFEERTFDYLLEDETKNCLVLVNESGSGDESLVEIRDGAVYNISKDIHQLGKIDGEFIGISRISLSAYKDMLLYFNQSQNPYLSYEYVFLNVKDRHVFNYTKIDDLVWSEIDTLEHYENLKYKVYNRLKRRETEFKEKNIIRQVSDILGDEYIIKTPIERLGGMNNFNYRINTNIKDLVFRMPGIGTNESVDRESELINARVADEIGLDSNLIYFDKKTGVKITEYIKDAETLNITTSKKESNMELIAHALNKLHNSGKKFAKDYDPFKGMEEYKKIIINNDKELLDNFNELDKVASYLEEELKVMKLEYAPCHFDALPENFIKSGNRIYLIDWEFSNNYDKLWDVVTIGLECEYSDDQEELFFYKYFDRKPSDTEIKKMDLLRVLMDIHWSIWAVSKYSCGQKDLWDYAIGRYNRGMKNLNKLKKYK